MGNNIDLTAPQQRAVDVSGRPVLVSAAAGSGKTRVLTERLMARVLAGADVARFLVITFTRAAAAQLRGRIQTELDRLAAADPGSKRLREQSARLYRAKIGTIDSFCADLVRENAHLLALSPGFAVLEEDRAEAMRARALEDVLDRAYEGIEQDRALRTLVDTVGAGRDDSALAELILRLHRQMQSHAFPEKWAAEALALLDKDHGDAAESPWGRYLLDDLAAEAAYQARQLEGALAAMARPENERMMAAYGEAFSELALLYRDAARASAESWDKTRETLARQIPGRKALRGFDDEALKERMGRVWKSANDRLKQLQKDMDRPSGALLAETAATKEPMRALTDLVRQLDEAYAERKRRANGCDFSDLEHMCVGLLCDENGGPTDLARAVSDRFDEVMVDEYQDVNGVQQTIFLRVSQEGQRLFTVGDVKQSIYRFRLAEPSIFIDRYDAFADPAQGERVLLRENFRSRPEVLRACNGVFGRIMSRALGDVEYNDEARLIPGKTDWPAEGSVQPELCLLDSAGLAEEDAPDKTMLEARYVAGRIRAMVEAGEPVTDENGGTRPVRYGDIALLLRTPGSTGAAYSRALAEAGVPVGSRQGGAFFSQPEVSFAISMLAVADNPRQDVALIAALRGLPFGFTPDELAAVRAAGKGDLWDALCRRAEADERCARFVDLVRQLRSCAREESTDRLLRRLYDSTRLMTICGVMADAPRRVADLMQLYEYARQFENSGGRGLFRFVSWLRDLERRGLEPPISGAGDGVQLMSIHKSKGLEWPVVFLADNGHGWNRSRTGQVLCHRRLGLGMRLTDAEKGVRWPTLPWLAIRLAEEREELSEQERVLYVGMTRAKERLIMTCVQKDPASALAACGGPSDGPIDPRQLLRAGSAAPWLLAAAAADGGRTIQVRIVSPEQARPDAVQAAEGQPLPDADPALTEQIGQRIAWTYPHQAAVSLPSKLTATAVSRMFAYDDGDAAPLPARAAGKKHLRRPDFGRAGRPLTGAERGVAAHLAMQYVDLAKADTADSVAAELDRLVRLGLLDEKQAQAVDPEDVTAFFHSPLGARLRTADRVMREFKFSLLCPAGTWYQDAGDESVLLQGVVDCCVEEDGQLTIIDFKTDRRMNPKRYAGQLRAYAMAMERIWQKPVKQAALWYLRLRQAAYIPLPKKK